jgi:hypothetical protein
LPLPIYMPQLSHGNFYPRAKTLGKDIMNDAFVRKVAKHAAEHAQEPMRRKRPVPTEDEEWPMWR